MSMRCHKILLVDDEKFILKMYQEKLEQANFQVSTATNGREAFKLAEEERPELILLDVVMNKQDGFSTLKKLKKNLNTKRIPVLMLTNLSSAKDRSEALRLGAAGYFVKVETEPHDLLKLVKRFIRE